MQNINDPFSFHGFAQASDVDRQKQLILMMDSLTDPSSSKYRDDPNIRIPVVGDKIRITNYAGFDGNESLRLDKLPYLTVQEILVIPISDNNAQSHYWEYSVYVDECEDLIEFGCYKIL